MRVLHAGDVLRRERRDAVHHENCRLVGQAEGELLGPCRIAVELRHAAGLAGLDVLADDPAAGVAGIRRGRKARPDAQSQNGRQQQGHGSFDLMIQQGLLAPFGLCF